MQPVGSGYINLHAVLQTSGFSSYLRDYGVSIRLSPDFLIWDEEEWSVEILLVLVSCLFIFAKRTGYSIHTGEVHAGSQTRNRREVSTKYLHIEI